MNTPATNTTPLLPCPYCGVPAQLVWVHGHGQCAHCKTNVDECCRGEEADCKLKADDTPALA